MLCLLACVLACLLACLGRAVARVCRNAVAAVGIGDYVALGALFPPGASIWEALGFLTNIWCYLSLAGLARDARMSCLAFCFTRECCFARSQAFRLAGLGSNIHPNWRTKC